MGLTRRQTLACSARVDIRGEAAAEVLDAAGLQALSRTHPDLLLVDVREPCEQRLGQAPDPGTPRVRHQAVALSQFPQALPGWLALSASTPIVFFCRSGNRSAQAADALRRLGHDRAWSLAGGLALWRPETAAAEASPA